MKTTTEITNEISSLITEMEALWVASDTAREGGRLERADYLDSISVLWADDIAGLQAVRNNMMRAQRIDLRSRLRAA